MVTPVYSHRPLPSLLDIQTPAERGLIAQENLEPEVLCSSLAEPDTSATEIAATSDDFLLMFSQYTEKDIFRLCESAIAFYPERIQKRIKRRLSSLYSMSLMNSRFNLIAKEMETNIEKYLLLSNKERFQSLIESADKTLEEKPKDSLKEIEGQIGLIEKLRQEITELLMLFSYIELGNKERIENLIEKTENFPKSRLRFQEFCQNLEICQNERMSLIQKQNALHRKIEELKKIVRALTLQTQPEILDPERKALYQNYDQNFWEVGVNFLTQAFRSTLKTGGNKGGLPELFIDAVKRASKIEDFRHLTLTKCFNKKPEDFPEQYIHEVWSYFIKDKTESDETADFMQHLLSKISHQSFLELKEKLKKSKNSKETIHKHFYEYLYGQTKGDLNLVSLKLWYTK